MDKRLLVIGVLFVLFALGITLQKTQVALYLILSLFVFGTLALVWKEKHIKLAGLAALVLLSLLNIGVNGLKFGIDFDGGVRIPILLEKSVDAQIMSEMVEIIKNRANFLGLGEVRVRAVGDNAIHVELPKASGETVAKIEQTLTQQGVFIGVADGTIALKGEDIYRESIRPIADPQRDWAVEFRLTAPGAKAFAEAVKGKANKPLYMFIDRPTDAYLFTTMEELRKNAPPDIGDEDVLRAATEALKLSDDTIMLHLLESENDSYAPITNKTRALIAKNASLEIKNMLKQKGFILLEFDDESMSPSITPAEIVSIDRWGAIGLLSSPLLSPSVTQGDVNYLGYSIGGNVPANTDAQNQVLQAQEEVRRIESILKGGAFPVQISIGSKNEIPASLGNESLRMSLIGIGVALLVVSSIIAFRYRSPRIIIPMIITSLAELTILLSIMGSVALDLAAIAGIIASIGVSVDAQIVITDEILKRSRDKIAQSIEAAFGVIKMNVVVAIFAMVPLLFSGIAELIPFAISTILGALLGFLISRPGYAVIAEYILEK